MITVQRLARRIPKKILAAFAIPATAFVLISAPPRVASLSAFAVLTIGLLVIGAVVINLNRALASGALQTTAGRKPKAVRWLEDRLWNGFSTTALDQLRTLSVDPSIAPHVRSHALATMSEWYVSTGHEQRAYDHAFLARLVDPRLARRGIQTLRPTPESLRAVRHFDVVLMSNFNLPGGTTSSNIQEIEAQTRAGLKTGLVHHPIYDWNVSKPINAKILELIDGNDVRFLSPHEHVACDLLIVRGAKIGERIMDDMPVIDAAKTVVVVNQTPMREYGLYGGSGDVWDVQLAFSGFQAQFGDHVWYPIGPRTRNALVDHHAAELDGIRLGDGDWLNIIDVDAWRRGARREPDGRMRIGRHSRDHEGKWPETPALLKAAYPDIAPYEVHILGGASVPNRTLGRLPRNWIVHPFDTVDVRDFLHSLDVYVYFTATDYVEAFGRAPLEALAVGLPTILPVQFKELFGNAAIYSEPEGVRTQVELLMRDDTLYAQQVESGLDAVRRRFGYEAHLQRLAALGVKA